MVEGAGREVVSVLLWFAQLDPAVRDNAVFVIVFLLVWCFADYRMPKVRG